MSLQSRMASSSSQPPLGSSVTRAFGKALGDRGDGLDFLFAAQHAALQLEIGEAVMILRGFGEPHDGVGRHRLLVAQVEPVGLPVSPST